MVDLVEEITQAGPDQLEKFLKAVLQRHAVLYPDWEVSVISLEKSSDRNEQLDGMIEMLRNMKTFP